MVYLIPKFKISTADAAKAGFSSPSATMSIGLFTAFLLSNGHTPDKIFLSDSPKFNLDCRRICGMMLFS